MVLEYHSLPDFDSGEGNYMQGGGKIQYTTGKFKQWLTFKGVNIYWPIYNNSITLMDESWGEFNFDSILPDDVTPDDRPPEDNIGKGFSLSNNQYLRSSNGVYKLGISPLSLIDGKGNKLWGPTMFIYSIGHVPLSGTSLVLQDDGDLVLYSTDEYVVWSSNTAGSGATKLVLQDDGNLVLYTDKNIPVWASQTAR